MKSDGAISGTRASGIVKVKVTYPANDRYETMDLTVDVPIKRRPAVMVAESAFKVAYGASRWGVTIAPTVTGTMPKSPHDGGTLYVPRYSITSRTNAGTTAMGGTIDQGTGVITGTQSSGTMVITVEHPRNVRYEAGVSKDIPLNIFAKPQGATANAGHGRFSTGANGTPTISDISSNYKDIRAYGDVLGGIRPTLTINDSGKYPVSGARYQFDYALFKDDGTLLSPSQAVTEFNSGKTVRIGLGSNPRSDKAIELVFKFPASADGKYGNKDLSIYWRTQLATPTTTDTLSFDDFVVTTAPAASGGVNVPSADILKQLKISGGQTQKSQWTIKKITLPANPQGVSVVSGQGINVNDTLGTATLTITLGHPSYKDKDVTMKVSKRLNPISTGTRSGSGKWGVGTYSTDYKLKTSLTGSGGSTVTFNKNTDYTFSILTGTPPSGYTATTAGMATAGAIGAKTGAIDASKLTKSGTLLVRIVRVAKGGISQSTEYQNFTVSKQDINDHANFKVTADALAWSGGAEEKVTYKGTNTPAGISDSPTYSLIKAGTTAGTVTGDGAGPVDVESDGAISGTRASGIVKVKVTYPANDKYEKMVVMVDVPIKRRPGLTVSESAFKVEYNRSYIWGTTITPTVTGTMPKSPHDGGPLYVPRYSIKSRTNAGTTAIGGTIDQGTGVITGTQSSGTLVVTVEHPRNIRYEAGRSKDIPLRIFAKPQGAAANAGHGRFSTGANGTPTISDISSNYKDIRAYGGVRGGIRPTLTINDSGKYPVSGARYQFDYALFKDDGTLLSPSQAVTEFNSGNTVRIGQINGNPNRSDKTIEFVFKFPASADGKYGNKDLSIYWRTP